MSQPAPSLTKAYLWHLADDDLTRHAQDAINQLRLFAVPEVERLLAPEVNLYSNGMYRSTPASYAIHLLQSLIDSRKMDKYKKLLEVGVAGDNTASTGHGIRAFVVQMNCLEACVEAARAKLPDGLELPKDILWQVVGFLMDP